MIKYICNNCESIASIKDLLRFNETDVLCKDCNKAFDKGREKLIRAYEEGYKVLKESFNIK